MHRDRTTLERPLSPATSSPEPMSDLAKNVSLLVVIPALNESRTITDVIRRIPRSIPGITEVSILIVDDGSTDDTVELARAAGAQVVSHPRNRGVGSAFQTGVERAIASGADYLLTLDGDGQFAPEDSYAVLKPLLDGQAGMATASRFADPALYPEMSRVKFYGNQMMSRLISSLCGKRFYDVSCGFRAYSRDAFLNLNLFGSFTYTQETFLDLTFKEVEIREVPVRIRGTREFGKSRVASSIARYAFQSAKIIFRSYRDYHPMRLFGAIASILAALGLVLAIFLLIHYLLNGQFTPHIWAGMTSGALIGLSALMFITGLIADMLARIRINQERMLFLLKKRAR